MADTDMLKKEENTLLASNNDSTNEHDPLLINSTDDNDDGMEHDGANCCHPSRSFYRYFALFFMCFLSFGSYYCYDNPAALQDIMKKALAIDTVAFSQFYAWYSWPNVILCFFGGYLIDRVFGIRLGAIIFSCMVLTGQLIFATGAYTNKLWLMYAARFIFGIGGESLAVAQNTYAVRWFKGKELNMVFGLQLSFARIGSTVNMNTMRRIYDLFSSQTELYKELGITLYVAALTCIFSLCCAFILAVLDWRKTKMLDEKSKPDGEPEEKAKLTDLKDFPITFWYVTIICVFYYVAVFPFIGLGLTFFIAKFNFDPDLANTVNSLVYLMAVGASPILGFIVDRTGRNVFWVIVAICLTLISHGLLGFTFLNPFVAMTLMGLSYSLLAAGLWPMVSLIIKEKSLGSAYGIMQSIQNLGLGVFAILTATIVDKKGYFLLEIFLLLSLFIALAAGIALLITNAKKNGKLNYSRKQRDLGSYEQIIE
ncbi:hypothetical protein SNEBB_002889 [Seison nebaliae]|nr:hypothetical protein SNEBB_002889 [Seison nebaliae]